MSFHSKRRKKSWARTRSASLALKNASWAEGLLEIFGGGRIVTRGAEVDMEGLRIYGEKMKELELLKRDPDIQRWIDLTYSKAGVK